MTSQGQIWQLLLLTLVETLSSPLAPINSLKN